MKLDKDILIKDFTRFSSEWIDTVEYNSSVYDYFEKQVDDHDSLLNHTEIVAKYRLGYGEKAFRYLWALVFSQMPKDGKFLEIGVFKGSILALSQLVSKELELEISTYGLTPLNNTGDKYSIYDIDNYEYAISFLYHNLGLNIDNTFIIEGLSTDENSKNSAKENGPYDVVYIDGGHDYETVISDIDLSTEILKPGGLLVMDDASSLLNLGPNHKGFPGHSDVGLAIRDHIDTKYTYKHLFACGHNRVWKKLF
jgi:hypothetical protein